MAPATERRERLQLAAWIQLALVGPWVAWCALVAIAVSDGIGSLCLDGTDAACAGQGPTGAWYAAVVLVVVYGVAVATLPVLLAHLHRRGALPRAAAVAGLTAPLPVAYVLTGVLL